MYGFERDHIISTTYDILQRVPQTRLYEYIVGYTPREHAYIRSPVREDTLPGTYYEWRRGMLYHLDYADPNRQVRDCFQVLMERKGLTLKQAIKELSEAFSVPDLPIIYPELAHKESRKEGDRQEGVGRKSSGLLDISFKSRAFDDDDKLFWHDRYGVRKSQLMDDGVFPITWYRFYSQRQGRWVIVRPYTVSYAYTDFDDGKIKIYCPFREKRMRFMTNCGVNDIGSIRKVSMSRQLVIAKSYKDCRVLRNEGVNAVWFQNEGMVPDMELIRKLCGPYDEVVLLFDNDQPGLQASVKLCSVIEPLTSASVRAAQVPLYQGLPIKDPADLRHHRGPDELKKFLDFSGIHH